MKPNAAKRKPYRNRGCRGIALLLTLGILLLLTILALAFSSSQLTESQAARNFYYAAKAEELALGGLDTAIALLRQDAMVNPDDPTSASDHLFERWAIYYDEGRDGSVDDDGFASDDEDDDKATDLSDYDELEHDVDRTGNFSNLSVRKDPSEDPLPDSRWIKVRAVDPGTGRERLVGRYAVCIEDESAKVNINTAGNPDPEQANSRKWENRQQLGFTTSEIDLGMIFENLGDLFYGVLDISSRYPENVSNQTALDVVAWRYGRRGSFDSISPGRDGDDNHTSTMPTLLQQDFNGIDDDADGLIDETDEEEDEPGEFDPYEPMAITAPGQLRTGENGVMGNDTPYLTVSQVKMAKSVSKPPKYSVENKLYPSLLPYITVYSQDLNRFSNRDIPGSSGDIKWYVRENIGRWLNGGAGEVYDSLKWMQNKGIAFTSTDDKTLERIAVRIYDFIDPDWFPTWYGGPEGGLGVEPTLYLNEVEATPPWVDGEPYGFEGYYEDAGEFIEIWNPYDIALDVRRYNIRVSLGTAMPIEDMDFAMPGTMVPAHGFFLIGDTLGDKRDIGKTEYLRNQTLPEGLPRGCNAYAPLKLPDSSLSIDLELRLDKSHVRVVERHSNIPSGRGGAAELAGQVTGQKNDPRMPDWYVRGMSLGTLNASLSSTGNVYRHFYMPGVRSRARDDSFDPNNPDDLAHAGGLTSIGELGMVHRGEHWESLDFTGQSSVSDYRKDVRLLDLLSMPYPYEDPDLREALDLDKSDPPPAPLVIPGRININTAPPEILLGLNWQPMFDEFGWPSALRYAMIKYIIDNRPYANLAGVARRMAKFPFRNPSEAKEEAFMKYNANLITTKSNVFKVTVLAEAFDRRGRVVASRKLEAVVDRGFTPAELPGRTTYEPSVNQSDVKLAETAQVLYYRWLTED